MFLLPALAAGTCDVLILYLSYHYEPTLEQQQREVAADADAGAHDYIYSVSYLVALACIRLILLLLPLPYHTYTGTPIKAPLLYHVLYGGTVLIVLLQMLAMIMLDPDSLTSFLPTDSTTRLPVLSSYNNKEPEESTTTTSATTSTTISTSSVSQLQQRHIWILLSLTLWSTVFHMVLLWHVRSTAPSYNNSIWKRRKRVLYYYAQNQTQSNNSHNTKQPALSILVPKDSNNLDDDNEEENIQQQQQPPPIQDETHDEMSALLVANGSNHNHANQRQRRQVMTTTGDGGRAGRSALPRVVPGEALMQQLRCLPDGYDEFMSELQTRLDTARIQWSERLDDFTNRLANHNNTNLEEVRAGGSVGSGPQHANPFLPLTPYRVLLQLFAYEEVLTNHRLDQVFEMDDGTALVFYVPQLLSFLLHGAYHNSQKLEEWILQKCSQNIFFAHQCFWFLRSWCLEGSHEETASQHNGGALSNTSSVASFTGLLEADNTIPTPISTPSPVASQPKHRRFPSLGSLGGSESSLGGGDLEIGRSSSSHNVLSKYHPEERSLIEALMLRVRDAGEIPAKTLHFGVANQEPEEDMNVKLAIVRGGKLIVDTRQEDEEEEQDETDSVNSPAALAMATEAGMIPIDPNYGYASVRHLESITSQSKFGFLPLPAQEEADYDSSFDGTPRFLEALISLADNLFLLSRERRTHELRRQLRSLEVEFLPSNAVYMPIGNVHHRVWRMVSDESIAISTKERVPCIVAMEVVDYSVAKRSRKHVRKTERETLDLWRTTLRNPQRHNSLLDNVTREVTNFTMMLSGQRGGSINQDLLLWGSEDFSGRGSWNDLMRMSRGDTDEEVDAEIASLTANNSMLSGKEEKEDVFVTGAARTDNDKPKRPSPTNKPPLAPAPSLTTTRPPVLTIGRTNGEPSMPSSRNSSRPPSPTTALGQWSSPTESPPQTESLRKKRKNRQNANGAREPEEDAGILHSMDEHNSWGGTLEITTAYGSAEGLQSLSPSASQRSTGSDTKKRRIPRPPTVCFKESWLHKQERIRSKSAYGTHPGWRLLPILIKSNDDLRQEQLASQLIYRMAAILAQDKVPVWLCPYEILALTDRGGIIEAIPDTISLDSLRRNDPNFISLSNFFINHFGEPGSDELADAKANFVESLAAYSIVCFLLQIKDRHNGNIMIDNRGHLIHIDFGFFFLSSPGKNAGFESAPFKLTSDFVDMMDGPDSNTFRTFRELCCRTFLSLRRHCYQITLLVEMLMVGNEDLMCFRGRPEDAVRGLRERFRLDLNDRACMEYVNELVDESLENWRTRWYDRYQRCCVGVL